jgi:uncharacterized protein YcnI
MLKRLIFASLLPVFCLQTASAHIMLAQRTAAPGSTYKATFRVPHGCNGSATTGITVFMPQGVSDVKGESKDGWSLSTKSEKTENGTERITQVSWLDSTLPNSDYAEFSIEMKLPTTQGKIYFHVLQQCEQGQNDWAAIATEGEKKPAFPAPALDLTTATQSEEGHMHDH